MSNYTPGRGDLIWVNFNPSKGYEQKGQRRALVLTPDKYNAFGLCYVLPITTAVKGYSVEVQLSSDQETSGVILTNQMLAIDWKSRNVAYIEKLETKTLDLVDSRLRTILSL